MNIERKGKEIVIDDGIYSFIESVRLGHGYDYYEKDAIAGKVKIHAAKIILKDDCVLAIEFESEEDAKEFSKKLTKFLLVSE